MRPLRHLAIAALTLGLAIPAAASTMPEQGKLVFDVIRKGKDIGDLSFAFSGSPNAYSVRIRTDVAVKVPLIRVNAYVFRQDSTETWSGGKLTAIKSTTDDDGKAHDLNTKGNGLVPASLWNDASVKGGKLLNTIDGKTMAVRITDLGVQPVPTGAGQIEAHHYRISGDLDRDVWYDAEGNLAHVSFTADDGSTVSYVRR